MVAAVFRQLDVFKAGLAATQASVELLVAQFRAMFEVHSRLEVGTLRAAQRKGRTEKGLKTLVCRRRTRSLRVGINAPSENSVLRLPQRGGRNALRGVTTAWGLLSVLCSTPSRKLKTG